jgi:membrane protein DedA with SNARE-associated domain
MTENLIGHLGYLGIVLLLVLGGLGLPVPEEAPIILAAVLSKKQTMWWPMALSSCFVGVLAGDFTVYFLGFFYGEKVLGFPPTRKFLTRAREAQIKGYFHRHGVKILILGRFAVGFRTAAYLTAGILRLPVLKLFLTDLLAASLSTLLMFGLGWRFAEWIEAGLREAKHWVFLIAFCALVAVLLYRFYWGRRRAGLPVGPPVLVGDEVPLPPDDLKAGVVDASPSVKNPLASSPVVQSQPVLVDSPEAPRSTSVERGELIAPEIDTSQSPKPDEPVVLDGEPHSASGLETSTPERAAEQP